MKYELLFSGIGGQGVITLGETLCDAAIKAGYNVTFVPFYGQEKRGGRTMCNIVISDTVESPIISEANIMLIFDEIQCGMGRTGHYFAWQAYGVQPDIMTSAKALGCGVPVGAFVLNEKAAKASLEPGDHGTTYGGNPFVCAAVSKVFDIYENDKIIEHVQEMTPYLEQKLDEIVAKHECAATRRGMGFMQGIVIQGRPVGEVVKAALAKGLLVISAGSDVLRIVPPLVITKEHIDKMAAILDECME